MMPDQLLLRGRVFTQTDICVIQACIEEHYEKGRTFISQEICRKLEWKQPNGWLKDRACRDVLLQLHESGYVKLPPPHTSKMSKKTNTVTHTSIKKVKQNYLTSYTLDSFPSNVSLVFAKGNTNEELWNSIVEEHHYLGHKVIVGRCIKYLIVSGEMILGAIAFSSPAWRLKPRDELLKYMGISATEARNLVINNSRFLIMPNAQVKNLASFVLALSTKAIVKDWEQYYSISPLFAETFVQPSRYYGTCYKAANWAEVGLSKGYAKSGSSYHNSQEPKKIFIYGLSRNTRGLLQQALVKHQEYANESK